MRLLRILTVVLLLSVVCSAQDANPAQTAAAQITGTVMDVNGDSLSGATVVLNGPAIAEPLKLISDDNGFFDFKQLAPGTYHLTVTAADFSDWSSSELTVTPGQYLIISDCKLRISQVATTVNVAYRPEEIPNFYVVYDPNPVPLTSKLKFRLALKTSTDPFTVAGIGAFAALNQAGDSPNYVQGWKGYGERVGAAAGDGFSDILIGGAILPSLLHQDPRYYYQGTGTTKSRMLHAISYPFICSWDNGKLQPNYSSVAGDLHITELVDGNKGVHMMIPKAIFVGANK